MVDEAATIRETTTLILPCAILHARPTPRRSPLDNGPPPGEDLFSSHDKKPLFTSLGRPHGTRCRSCLEESSTLVNPLTAITKTIPNWPTELYIPHHFTLSWTVTELDIAARPDRRCRRGTTHGGRTGYRHDAI